MRPRFSTEERHMHRAASDHHLFWFSWFLLWIKRCSVTCRIHSTAKRFWEAFGGFSMQGYPPHHCQGSYMFKELAPVSGGAFLRCQKQGGEIWVHLHEWAKGKNEVGKEERRPRP